MGESGEVDGLRDAALEGHAVQLDVAELAASVEPRVVDENRVGLELPDHAVEHVLVPVLVGVRPDAVEPEAADATVVGAEQSEGFPQVVRVGGPVVRTALLVPVLERVVEEGNEALLAAGVHELRDEVAPARVRRVEGREAARVAEGEAVVVAAGERDVAEAGTSRRVCEVGRPIRLGAEAVRKPFVLVSAHGDEVPRPLAAAEHAVEAEVHEEAKPHPLEVLDALLDDHASPLLGRSCRQMVDLPWWRARNSHWRAALCHA